MFSPNATNYAVTTFLTARITARGTYFAWKRFSKSCQFGYLNTTYIYIQLNFFFQTMNHSPPPLAIHMKS